jgi:hypothetical protein
VITINAIDVDRVEKELTDLLLRENKELDTPVRWHDNIEEVFRRVAEAMEELKNHPDGADRLVYLSDTVFSLLLSRRVKFSLSNANHQSSIDTLFYEAAKSSALQIIGMFGKDAMHQNEERVNGQQAKPLAVNINSPSGKESKPELEKEVSAVPSTGNDARNSDPYKGYILVRMVQEFTDPKPFQAEVLDPNDPNKTKTYYLRNGEMFHAPVSLAKFLMERHMAVPVNIDTKVI